MHSNARVMYNNSSMENNAVLYVVVPCYNEEEVLDETVTRLSLKLQIMINEGAINSKSRIMLVNDGSKDSTWEIISGLNSTNDYVTGVNLSRNMGHQNALLAGLMTAKEYADIVISMDADLQDDIEVIDDFVKEYYNGAEIVYGVRSSRKKDSFFKRNSAVLFYKLMKFMGVELVYNHADYRLMSKRALEELENYQEVNLFLRGIIPMIGFKTATVEYERAERFAGESKYPLSKMISFALEGITSCSVKPIKLITSVGMFISLVSFIFLVYVVIATIMGAAYMVKGWPTIIVLICFFGGFQIMCIGIVGEYIGKIYKESKHRPRYTIDEIKLK